MKLKGSFRTRSPVLGSGELGENTFVIEQKGVRNIQFDRLYTKSNH